MTDEVLRTATTPIGLVVLIRRGAWEKIATVKHPIMASRLDDVAATIAGPDEIRRSRSAPDVLLCYRLERPGRWLCAVVKQSEGSLITSYLTDAIKKGTVLWKR